VSTPVDTTQIPERRSPFSAELPHFQIAWDSTSLGVLKECPRKYQYEIIFGWRTPQSNVHLTFGQLYHAGPEAYDHFAASIGKLDGGLTDDEHDEGVRVALRRVFREAGEYVRPKCSSCQGIGQLMVGENPITNDKLWETCELCGGSGSYGEPVWQPWRSTDPYKNMWTLTRSITWYLDLFRNSALRTVQLSNGKPAVELSFFFEANEVDGISYGLCGHLDRVVHNINEPSQGESTHDRKTTKSQLNYGYWAGFSPHNQFSLYTAASAIHYERPTYGVTVDAAQILVEGTRFDRQFIPFPPQVINEWLGETHVWITLAKRFAEANSWPKNDKSCNNFGGCPFRRVCSKAPAFRQDWLESDFIVRKWNPLEVRGDI